MEQLVCAVFSNNLIVVVAKVSTKAAKDRALAIARRFYGDGNVILISEDGLKRALDTGAWRRKDVNLSAIVM